MTNLNSDIIILDNGSGYLKCGFSSKEQPLYTIPSLIGRPMLRYDEKIENFNIKVNSSGFFKVLFLECYDW